jgi:hypothetical protein
MAIVLNVAKEFTVGDKTYKVSKLPIPRLAEFQKKVLAVSELESANDLDGISSLMTSMVKEVLDFSGNTTTKEEIENMLTKEVFEFIIKVSFGAE